MISIKLPQDMNIIEDILNYYNRKIYLSGSGADHFLLNRSESTLKDLDFITDQPDAVQNVGEQLIKIDSNYHGENFKYVSFWNHKYLLEFFVMSRLSSDQLYYCEKLNCKIESKTHRISVLNKILSSYSTNNTSNKFYLTKLAYEEYTNAD